METHQVLDLICRSCKNDARSLWRKVRTLMSPPAQCDTSNHSADDFIVHFLVKIEKIHTAIRSTAANLLSSSRPVDAAEFIRLLSRSYSSQSLSVQSSADLARPAYCSDTFTSS